LGEPSFYQGKSAGAVRIRVFLTLKEYGYFHVPPKEILSMIRVRRAPEFDSITDRRGEERRGVYSITHLVKQAANP
jgi:hypothetical protein